MCTLQGWCIVDSVSSHNTESLATTQCINHSDFGCRTASSEDEWERRQGVDLFLR